jgi:hypothetical protein
MIVDMFSGPLIDPTHCGVVVEFIAIVAISCFMTTWVTMVLPMSLICIIASSKCNIIAFATYYLPCCSKKDPKGVSIASISSTLKH